MGRLLLIASVLVLNSILIQAQELNFNPDNRQLTFFKHNNFDPFYSGSDHDVNELLFNACRAKRDADLVYVGAGISTLIPAVGPYVFLGGTVLATYVKSEGIAMLRKATVMHINSLTGGQSYSGTEPFRKKFRARWYRKKNFHVNFYDGENLLVNAHLQQAWKLNQKADRQLVVGGVAVFTGGTLLFWAFLNALLGDENSQISTNNLLLSGILLSGMGTTLAISSNKKRNESNANLWDAAEMWYAGLHKKQPRDN